MKSRSNRISVVLALTADGALADEFRDLILHLRLVLFAGLGQVTLTDATMISFAVMIVTNDLLLTEIFFHVLYLGFS